MAKWKVDCKRKVYDNKMRIRVCWFKTIEGLFSRLYIERGKIGLFSSVSSLQSSNCRRLKGVRMD